MNVNHTDYTIKSNSLSRRQCIDKSRQSVEYFSDDLTEETAYVQLKTDSLEALDGHD